MPILRMRDVRPMIKEHGFESAMATLMERLIEEHNDTRTYVKQVTDVTSRLVNELETMLGIADGMRNKLEDMKRERDQSAEA